MLPIALTLACILLPWWLARRMARKRKRQRLVRHFARDYTAWKAGDRHARDHAHQWHLALGRHDSR